MSNSCNIKLESRGLIIPPWGTPTVESMNRIFPFSHSTYPALTNFQYIFRSRLSLKCFDRSLAKTWWSIESKKDFISPSRSQGTPFQFLMYFSAEWQPLLGRNPWLVSRNFGSMMISNTILSACCTILSLGEPIPSGLFFPLALGMYTLREGLNS